MKKRAIKCSTNAKDQLCVTKKITMSRRLPECSSIVMFWKYELSSALDQLDAYSVFSAAGAAVSVVAAGAGASSLFSVVAAAG